MGEANAELVSVSESREYLDRKGRKENRNLGDAKSGRNPITFSFGDLCGQCSGIAFVVWGYRSGQGYLRRMFGSVRRELADCLRDLEQA